MLGDRVFVVLVIAILCGVGFAVIEAVVYVCSSWRVYGVLIVIVLVSGCAGAEEELEPPC